MKLDILQLRQEKGLSQGQVARAVGISRPTYVIKERDPSKFTLAEWGLLAQLLEFDPSTHEAVKYTTCQYCDGVGYTEEEV